MKNNHLTWHKLLTIFSLITILALLAACSTTPGSTPTLSSTTAPASTPSPSPSSNPLTVNISSSPAAGNYLVDSKGMTLYYFAKDITGKSNAAGAILQTWPIFNAGTISVPASLNIADFATITRDDGQKQTTYKGWPLYYYSKDGNAGDILGEGVAGIWFVIKVPFYTVMLQNKTDIGNYMVDGSGMTLYYFTKDSVGKSTATGTVLANWPLFNPTSFIIPSTLNTSDFGTITRDDGQKVATYKGWPLYYYVKDQVSGDTLGQGVGGVWFVIDPANFPAPTSSTTPTISSTSPVLPTPTPTPTPTPSPSSTASPSAALISIQGFAFDPNSITVAVGTKVTWTNNDSAAHTVTSDSSLFNDSLNPGATFSYTFTQAGTFSYHCSVHPSMTGKVIVQ
jgi:predicted lipoprotein with Yx(FWY)xxD motif/plastocyanin